VRDETTLHRVSDAYASSYDWHVTVRDGAFHDTEGAPTAGPPPYVVYEIMSLNGLRARFGRVVQPDTVGVCGAERMTPSRSAR
jgi:hypothetical protein